MPSRARARRDKNRAEKIAELNENSIQDTERDISMEAQERKKQRDKKRYANDPESNLRSLTKRPVGLKTE